MNCDQVYQKYKDYMLGKLPEEENEKISDHILDCIDCFQMDMREKGIHRIKTADGRETGFKTTNFVRFGSGLKKYRREK